MKDPLASLALLLSVLLVSLPSLADDKKEIDQLVANKKYLSAARYIKTRPMLMKSDEHFRRYVHILVNYYAMTINYDIFGLRDLKPNEDIEKVRGSGGTYELLGPGIEAQLFKRYNQRPKSPYINLAVGEYLSRQAACGCGQPTKFNGTRAAEYPYLKFAYDTGLRDAWQLFRMGLHWQQAGNSKRAISFYEQSLKLKPDDQDALYNLALAYFQDNQDARARTYAKKALGGYKDPELNSDTYDLYGSVLYSAGEKAKAEKHLRKAMALQTWHPHAFHTLARIYREQEQEKKYNRLVLDYIGQDFGNTFMFNKYIEFLSASGFSPYDENIVDTLGKRKFNTPLETGAVHFNLGRLARARGKAAQAQKHFETSLDAMQKAKNPPKDAIQAIKEMLAAK